MTTIRSGFVVNRLEGGPVFHLDRAYPPELLERVAAAMDEQGLTVDDVVVADVADDGAVTFTTVEVPGS